MLLVALGVAACNPPPAVPEPGPVPVSSASSMPVVAAPRSAELEPASIPAPPSCASRAPATEHPLRKVAPAGQAGGAAYAVGIQGDVNHEKAVLVGLSGSGKLSLTTIPHAPVLTATTPTKIYYLAMSPDRRMLFLGGVDVAKPDEPRVLPELSLSKIPVNVLGALAVDDLRAIVAGMVYQNGKDQWNTYLVDLRDGSTVTVREQFFGSEASFCDGVACTLVGLDHTTKRSLVVRIPHDGSAPSEQVLGPYPGNRIDRVKTPEGTALLHGGEGTYSGFFVTRERPFSTPIGPFSGSTTQCPFDPVIEGATPGILVCPQEQKPVFRRWDASARKLEQGAPWPASGYRSERFAAQGEGILRVAWEGGAGLMHGPEFQGMREYHQHWSFQGGSASLLLPRKGGEGGLGEGGLGEGGLGEGGGRKTGWEERDRVALPLHDAHGEFSRGYSPVLLVRGAFAAVLLASDGWGDPAYFQLLREPCAP